MATRQWVGELERWMREQNLSKEEVAKRAAHKTAHVLELFEQLEPNPTLKLYLGVVEATGGRFHGVRDNSPRAFMQRFTQLCDRENITVSDLARRAGVNRSTLSTHLNSDSPNPKLRMIDALVTALGIEADIKLVALDSVKIKLVARASGDAEATVREREREVAASKRHLSLVEKRARETGDQRAVKAAKAELSVAREELADARREVTRLKAECASLREANVALERKIADGEARERAMAKQALADAQKIAALKKAKLWNRLQILGASVLGAGLGFGVSAIVLGDKK